MSVLHNLEEEIDFVANQRQVSDRCLFLLKKLWEETLGETINKSGTELQWAEREELCKNVSDMYKAAKDSDGCNTGDGSGFFPRVGRPRKVLVAGDMERNEAANSCISSTSVMSPNDGYESNSLQDHMDYTSLECVTVEESCCKSKEKCCVDLLERKADFEEEMRRAELKMRLEQNNREAEWRERQIAMDERRLRMEEERMRLDDARETKRLKLEEERIALKRERIDENKQQQKVYLHLLQLFAGQSKPNS